MHPSPHTLHARHVSAWKHFSGWQRAPSSSIWSVSLFLDTMGRHTHTECTFSHSRNAAVSCVCLGRIQTHLRFLGAVRSLSPDFVSGGNQSIHQKTMLVNTGTHVACEGIERHNGSLHAHRPQRKTLSRSPHFYIVQHAPKKMPPTCTQRDMLELSCGHLVSRHVLKKQKDPCFKSTAPIHILLQHCCRIGIFSHTHNMHHALPCMCCATDSVRKTDSIVGNTCFGKVHFAVSLSVPVMQQDNAWRWPQDCIRGRVHGTATHTQTVCASTKYESEYTSEYTACYHEGKQVLSKGMCAVFPSHSFPSGCVFMQEVFPSPVACWTMHSLSCGIAEDTRRTSQEHFLFHVADSLCFLP